MGEENSPKQPKTTRRKKNSAALRDSQIRAMSMAGKTNTEIGEHFGIGRKDVAKILTNEETKAIVKQAESRLIEMINEAIDTVAFAMKKRTEERSLGHALHAAISVLKNSGALKDKLEVNHTGIKPTVIYGFQGDVAAVLTVKEEE